jgi:hypothetical protein
MKQFTPGQADTRAFIDQHKVYKVVHFKLRSCIAVGSYCVRYRVGEFITAPEGTKFFVFDSLSHADDFMHLDPDFRVWRATARGLYSPPRRVGYPQHSVDIEDFWRAHNSDRSYGILAGRRTPFGTLWADEIRLDACLW